MFDPVYQSWRAMPLTSCRWPMHRSSSCRKITEKMLLFCQRGWWHRLREIYPCSFYGKKFIGCQYGWLAVTDAYCEPSLFNVLTNESISLPSISTLPNVHPMFSIDGSLDFYRHHYQMHSGAPFEEDTLDFFCRIVTFSKLVISSDPSLSTGGFVVAALFYYPERIVYARPEEGRWKFLDDDERYVDLVFCQDGTLLALTYLGAVYRFELLEDGDFAKTEVSPPFATIYSDNRKYLVEDSDQGLLQIWREYSYDDDTPETCEIQVLRLLTNTEGNKKWEPVPNLHDKAIFIGIGITKLLSADLHHMIRPNCVYFTDDWWDLLITDHYRRKCEILVCTAWRIVYLRNAVLANSVTVLGLCQYGFILKQQLWNDEIKKKKTKCILFQNLYCQILVIKTSMLQDLEMHFVLLKLYLII